jgi:hypothetical protein|tara:strand:- start:245 stop:460 length:216 start_codon:yes stop_codon:yes gene_type:complete
MKKGTLVKLKGDDDAWFGYGLVVELSGSRMCRVLWTKDFVTNNNDPFLDPDDDLIWNSNLVVIQEPETKSI